MEVYMLVKRGECVHCAMYDDQYGVSVHTTESFPMDREDVTGSFDIKDGYERHVVQKIWDAWCRNKSSGYWEIINGRELLYQPSA